MIVKEFIKSIGGNPDELKELTKARIAFLLNMGAFACDPKCDIQTAKYYVDKELHQEVVCDEQPTDAAAKALNSDIGTDFDMNTLATALFSFLSGREEMSELGRDKAAEYAQEVV